MDGWLLLSGACLVFQVCQVLPTPSVCLDEALDQKFGGTGEDLFDMSSVLDLQLIRIWKWLVAAVVPGIQEGGQEAGKVVNFVFGIF